MTNPYFAPLVISGNVVNLSHLEPFTFSFQSVSANNKQLRVHVTFSNHCFTQGYSVGMLNSSGGPILKDEGGRDRLFCPIRYQLSTQLPSVIHSLNAPQMKVRQTKQERNWVHSITIPDPAGPYHMFFRLKKTQQEHRTWRELDMRIESAYHQQGAAPDTIGRVGFWALCSNVYLGKPIATKR